MKKVLIIVYYWPPASGPGVQRWLKFTKYLPLYGWQPIILTVKNGSYPAIDHSLVEEVPDEVPVFKTTSLEPHQFFNFIRGKKGKKVNVGMDQDTQASNLFKKWVNGLGMYARANIFVPDARIGWKPFAIPMAKKIIKQYQPDCVVTSGPPQSTHLIGLQLQKIYHLPWLADLRDPWTNAYYNNSLQRNKQALNKDKSLENQVIQSSDHISVVSPGMRDEFIERNTHISILYNGYDETDFEQIPDSIRTDQFTLQYVGSFKNTEIHIPLWLAIRELLDESESFANHFRLVFTGNVTDAVKESIVEHALSNQVTYRGFVDHEEAIQDMIQANLLLFILADLPGSHKVVTGKILEYLASGTPIFGIGIQNGGADQILQACGRPGLYDYNQKNLYKKALKAYFEEWLNNRQVSKKHRIGIHEQYSRRGITQQLAKILNQITSKAE